MTIPGFITGKIFFPISDIISGLKVGYYNKFLKKSQWWSYKDLKKYQETNLRKLIVYAYKNVPFYHESMKKVDVKPSDIKGLEDLNKLPIVEKRDIKKNWNKFLSKDKTRKFKPNATGGSTGEPLKYMVDYESLSIGISAMYRSWYAAGYKFGDHIVTLGGRSLLSDQKKSFPKKMKDFIEGHVFLSAFDMNEENMRKFVKEINRIKPSVIRGYASALYELSLFMNKGYYLDYRPKGIVTTAEKLFPKQRKSIEEAFDTKVFDTYGARDGNPNAFECEEHDGLHYSMETAIIESLADGEPVQNETGEFIVTDLHNYAFPFIRYRVGDIGIMSDEKCPCGRGLPLIKELKGRIQDFVVTKNGTKVHGEFFSHIFWEIPGVDTFQVIQKREGKIRIDIVPNEQITENDKTKLISIITKNFPDLEVEIKYVNKIRKTRSNKYRIVIK